MTATVLVVEDELKIRDLLRSYLERDGHVVLSTSSGAEAISLARNAHPNLIVLDLRLPDVPGEEVGARGAVVLERADRDVDGEVGRGGPHPRSGVGCGRLRHQTVQSAELVLRVQAILRRGEEAMPARSARPRSVVPNWCSTRIVVK